MPLGVGAVLKGGVVALARAADSVGPARVVHEPVDDGAGLAGEGADEALPVVPKVDDSPRVRNGR